MIATDTGALILSALCLVALHSATNNQYGFQLLRRPGCGDRHGTDRLMAREIGGKRPA
jgi:hypothetical protein